MTTPRRTLSESQIEQRRAASRAAAARRRERGLTEAELAQRRAAARAGGVASAMRRRADRFAAERQAARGQIREAQAEAREADIRHIDAGFSMETREDLREANTRVFLARGIISNTRPRDPDWIWINEKQLLRVPVDNPALKSFFRKWDNLAKKGFSREQIQTQLEQRLVMLQRQRRDNVNSDRILDLVREFYKRERRTRRRSA